MSSRSASTLHSARYLVLVLLLTMPVWTILTRPGLPATQVGPLPVLQLQVTTQGQISLSLARLVTAMGVDPLAYIKFSALIALLLLVIGVFAWARVLAGSRAGVLASVIVAFAPVFLSMLFRDGDWSLIWTMAGLVWAAFGLLSLPRWGLALAAVGAFAATSAHPGLGVWTLAGLILLTIGNKRWLGIVAFLVGGAIGVLLSTPWAGTAMPEVSAIGTELYQLIEPGWLWGVSTLSLNTPLSFSLGFALLALLILAGWSYFQRSEIGNQRSVEASDSVPDDEIQVSYPQNQITDGEQLSESVAPVAGNQETIHNQQSTANSQQGHSTWFWHLGIGLGFVFFSLDFVAQPLGFVSGTVGAPWHLLLLALPFLAIAAVFTLRFIPRLQETPLWASLIVITILGAGPGLSPEFQTNDIPASPVAIYGDSQVTLLRLETAGELKPGTHVVLTADWFSSRSIDFDYNIFIHVVDDAGKTIAQLDTQPQAGERPMTSWLSGEIISDSYELSIPADASSDLRLRLGLYNWQTGERMGVNGNDAIELHPDEIK